MIKQTFLLIQINTFQTSTIYKEHNPCNKASPRNPFSGNRQKKYKGIKTIIRLITLRKLIILNNNSHNIPAINLMFQQKTS